MDTITSGARLRVWDALERRYGADVAAEAADFTDCPWCLGFWISVGVWGSWRASPARTVRLAVPLAVSAAVGIVAKLD